MSKGDAKKKATREKNDRLLRLFNGDGYEEFHTPKYVFVKQWNGDNKSWQVAIYTTESFQRSQQRLQPTLHLRSIMQEE